MKNKLMKHVDASSVPSGTYKGEWSGYVVKFSTSPNDTYELAVKDGMRGIVPCLVHVDDGKILFEPNC